MTGNLGDRPALDTAMRGVYGVFSVQMPPVSDGVVDQDGTEVRWGTNVADAAAAAGVDHLVYASAIGADRDSDIGIVRNKGRIEQHIRSLGLPATILRPASFMENYTGPSAAARMRDGNVTTALAPGVADHLIALRDIGAFAALAFADPGTYLGQAVDLAGDALTPVQIAAAMSEATGRDIRYVQIPLDELRAFSPEIARAFEKMNSGEAFTTVDLPRLRRAHPALLDFTTWLREEGAAKIDAGFRAAAT